MVPMPDLGRSRFPGPVRLGRPNSQFINKIRAVLFGAFGASFIQVGKSLGLLGLAGLVGCLDHPRTPGNPSEMHVAITPAEAILTVGHRSGFSLSSPAEQSGRIVWSVVEAGGGGFKGAGIYQAPPTEGVYTIQAAMEGSRSALAQAKVTVVAEPEKEISAPARVPPDADGLTATILPTPHGSYYWAISGGRITRGKRKNKVTFQAGDGNLLVLTCTVTNLAGDSIRASRKIPIAPPEPIASR